MLTNKYKDALQLAFDVHQSDYRKGKDVPYFAHLIAVSSLVLEYGGDEEEAIAGLLHDTLEDHPEAISFNDIEARFGGKVAEIVRGCSDTPENFSGGTKPPWDERKGAYLKHLKEAPASTLRVALADKLHNARDIYSDLLVHGDEVWTRFNAPKEKQLWYLQGLVGVFTNRLPQNQMAQQFEHVVNQIMTLVVKQFSRGDFADVDSSRPSPLSPKHQMLLREMRKGGR